MNNWLRRATVQASLFLVALSSFSLSCFSNDVEAVATGSNSTHSHVIPIRHSTANNAIVFIANGTYRPGPGVTTVRVTMSGGGGQGGGAMNSGSGGSPSTFNGLFAARGLGGSYTGSSPNGETGNGDGYSGWETTFPLAQRAGSSFGTGGNGPGAGGGASAATSTGGRKGGYIYRQAVAVTPGTAYDVFVGRGGSGAPGAGAKGADGFVLIEW